MALIRCDFHSASLDMSTSMVLLLPEDRPSSKVPVVYLLHGLSDNCTGWTRYTSVERYARSYGIALVMPEVQRSFYADMALGLPYFEFLTEDLPKTLSNLFSLSRDDCYMMGLSMGGYGAMKCVLTYPERYKGAAAFSSVAGIKAAFSEASGKRKAEFSAIFGSEVPDDADLYKLLEKADPSALPPFLMTCGDADTRLCQNKAFYNSLKEKGVPCRFLSWEGAHEWAFWDKSVSIAFDYFFKERRDG